MVIEKETLYSPTLAKCIQFGVPYSFRDMADDYENMVEDKGDDVEQEYVNVFREIMEAAGFPITHVEAVESIVKDNFDYLADNIENDIIPG